MGRRDKVGGKSAKTPRAKTLKHRDAPKIQRRGISLATGEETNVEQLTRELAEAREREAATSEVLQVISSSPGDLRPVFATMLANAVRICEAKFGVMHLYEEGAFHVVAMHNVPPAFAEERRNIPIVRPSPGTGLGRAAHTKQVVQIPDLRTYQTY